MAQKTQRKSITESLVENIKETSHWIFVYAPIIASALATWFRSDTHILEFTVIALAISINFLILWLRSKIAEQENKELSLFYTFRTNNLLPNQSGEELVLSTDVAVVEYKGRQYFIEKLKKKFESEPSDVNADRVEDKDERLRFISVGCESFNKEGLDEDDQKRKIAELENDLQSRLSKSEAVVVIRTEELEKESWVYEAVDNWAYKNSEVPILFVRPKDRVIYKKHKIADRFYWIPDDPKSLPWRLLKRATDRASAWRSQASYNRALVTNIISLSLMIIWIGAFAIQHKISQYETAIDGMYEALETKSLYQKEVIMKEDDKLHVSYWFVHNGKPYIFVSTEKNKTTNNYESNSKSIIGCGFGSPNTFTEWQESDKQGLKATFTTFGIIKTLILKNLNLVVQ